MESRGLIEFKPGKGWGIENTTSVRRKTVEEIKPLARRCAKEKYRIHHKKQREIKSSINTQDIISSPRLADRLEEMMGGG